MPSTGDGSRRSTGRGRGWRQVIAQTLYGPGNPEQPAGSPKQGDMEIETAAPASDASSSTQQVEQMVVSQDQTMDISPAQTRRSSGTDSNIVIAENADFDRASSVSSMAANTSMAPSTGSADVSQNDMAVEASGEGDNEAMTAQSSTTSSNGSSRPKLQRLRANTTGSTNFTSSGSASSSASTATAIANSTAEAVASTDSMATAMSQDGMEDAVEGDVNPDVNNVDAVQDASNADASNADSAADGGSGDAIAKKTREGVSLLDDEKVENLFSKMTTQQKEEWNSSLQGVVKGLVLSRRQYLNHADENWQNFLDKVQGAFAFFAQGKNPRRDYRDNFTIENYRMLFQRESAAFRDDVCRGVKRIRDGMWVNGEEVKFPPELVTQGYELAERGEKLMDVVYMLDDESMHKQQTVAYTTARAQTLTKLKAGIKSFDEKYMTFEQDYIEALIAVEKQSRSLVENIATRIKQNKEEKVSCDPTLLNQMAQLQKKSRDCHNCSYNFEVFDSAFSGAYKKVVHKRMWYLAGELINSFKEVCDYLLNLLAKILRVHPKLEHNPGLVARLERLHECYKKFNEWVKPQSAMSRFCEFLEAYAPKQTCEASIENIMQCPRLFCAWVWENRAEIEGGAGSQMTNLVHELHPELLTELAMVMLTNPEFESATMQKMVDDILENGVDSENPSDFCKALESVSMSLQRKNAERWNAFAAIMLYDEEDNAETMATRPRLPSV